MYLGSHALTNPDRPALIMTATGEIVTYAELENRLDGLQTGSLMPVG